MLEYLDQVVQELERAHVSLHTILGNRPERGSHFMQAFPKVSWQGARCRNLCV